VRHAGELDFNHPLVWTIPDVLDFDECADLIEKIEEMGPELATVDRPEGHVIDTKTRNSGRVIFDDRALADKIFAKAISHPRREGIPKELRGMKRVGLNERFRCYRYRHGEYFGMHYDGAFVRNEKEQSLLTFMVYLNGGEGLIGGQTNFPKLEHVIEPAPGLALVFQHRILHEGVRVQSGTKYVVRSDVMYQHVPVDKDENHLSPEEEAFFG
jgi:prolyl 4-hydroxylase